MALVCTAFWIFMAVSKSAQRHSLLTRACNLFFNSICVCPHAFAKMKSWYVLDNKPDVILGFFENSCQKKQMYVESAILQKFL